MSLDVKMCVRGILKVKFPALQNIYVNNVSSTDAYG